MKRQADVLAPASAKESGRFLLGLPSAPSRAWWTGFLGLYILTVFFMTLGSQLLGRIVDLIAGDSLPVLGSGQSALVAACVVVAVCFIMEQFGREFGAYLGNAQVARFAIDLRKACLDAALRAPVPRVLELGTGNVITRLSKDIDTPVMTMGYVGARLMITLLIVPITAIAMALIHPMYLLLFVAAGLLMWPWIKGTMVSIPAVTNMVSSVEAQRNTVLLDTIRALETLRKFRLGRWATTRMEASSWNTAQAWADKVPLFNRIIGQGSVAYGIVLIGGLALSAAMVHADWVSIGEASAAMILITRLEVHVFNLLIFAGEIQHAVTSLGRAVSLAQLASDDVTSTGPEPTLAANPDVTISGLSYAYPGGNNVLTDINLTLAGGTTTALVGTSGAGKSTLAALVAGLQYPTEGSIRVGDVDTAHVPNTWITRHVALVTQDVHLFSGTLRDDLLLAAPTASDDDLTSALRTVGLEPGSATWERWLAHGLDTQIGAGNEDVGPDVAQQISLARMVLRQPPVLIMDEATSEAGSEHAATLESAARAVARGRTTLVVAHRLDQAREADRIIVMEAGQIVEDGTHSELLRAGGRYARAYHQWESGQAL